MGKAKANGTGDQKQCLPCGVKGVNCLKGWGNTWVMEMFQNMVCHYLRQSRYRTFPLRSKLN